MGKNGRTKGFGAAFLVTVLLFGASGSLAYGQNEMRVDLFRLLESAETLLELSQLHETAANRVVLRQTSRRQRLSAAEVKFTNLVEGYCLTVPEEARADMSLAGIRAVLEWDAVRLEVYREALFSDLDFETYRLLSSQFAQNRTDHTLEREWGFWVGENEAYLTSWHRQMLEKVVEDRNYYTAVDLFVAGEGVFTFLFKSTSPLDENTCIAIVASLELTEPEQKDFAIRFPSAWQQERWNAETAVAFETYFGEESLLTWGIFDPMAPAGMEPLLKLEDELAYQFPVLLSYGNIKDSHNLLQLRKELDNAREQERLLLLTLQTTVQAGEQSSMVYELLEGEYDSFLRAFAIELKLANQPVLLRLCNEMNRNGNGYGAASLSRDAELYKAMYRYVFDFLAREEALEHVIWVWDPGERSTPDYKWNHEFLYYPGDRYVDVVGLNGFNTGTFYQGEQWRSFAEIFESRYAQAVFAYPKPLMITEVASSSVGGDKEAWVRDMFTQLTRYPAIKVALWWDHSDYDETGAPARRYWLAETEALQEIFRQQLENVLGE